MKTVRDIIAAAGGPREIARAAKKSRYKLVAKSVYDWPTIGIPEKHWATILKLADVSVAELHQANEAVRARPFKRRALVDA
jgi:hypothetical protein